MMVKRKAPPAEPGKRGQKGKLPLPLLLPLPGVGFKAPLPVLRRLIERYASPIMREPEPWPWCAPVSLLVDAEAQALDEALDKASRGRFLQ